MKVLFLIILLLATVHFSMYIQIHVILTTKKIVDTFPFLYLEIQVHSILLIVKNVPQKKKKILIRLFITYISKILITFPISKVSLTAN